jgi:hypothetical protein
VEFHVVLLALLELGWPYRYRHWRHYKMLRPMLVVWWHWNERLRWWHARIGLLGRCKLFVVGGLLVGFGD